MASEDLSYIDIRELQSVMEPIQTILEQRGIAGDHVAIREIALYMIVMTLDEEESEEPGLGASNAQELAEFFDGLSESDQLGAMLTE